MIRRFALLVAVLAVVAPPAAHAQETGNLEVTGAELIFESGVSETVVVKGTGRCATAGDVLIRAQVRDLETGGRGVGSATTRCIHAGELIQWSVQVIARGTRPGDRALVQAAANGAISDADSKEVILQWQA